MEKYEQHGLTRAEDGILGSFGVHEPLEETFPIEHFVDPLFPPTLMSVKSLIRKGLLKATVSTDLGVEVQLTPKGSKLWRIRAKEEEE